MGVWIVIAIAILVLVLWLAFQPKQGEKAANAPDSYQSNPPHTTPPAAETTSNFSEDFSNLPPDPPNFEDLSDLPPDTPHFEDQSSSILDSPSVLNPILVSNDLRQQVQQFVAEGRTITAVKKLRQQGMALQEAKQYLDTLPKLPPINEFGKPSTSLNRAEVDSEVRQMLSQNRKIQAIKFVRLQLGYGLKEAKDYVESLGR